MADVFAEDEPHLMVWVPGGPPGGDRGLPRDRPMGRAAARLAEAGVPVVFGDQLEDGTGTGVRVESGRWVDVKVPVVAVQDRYPSQGRAARWEALHAAAKAAGIPVGNGRALTLLCRDKLECQAVLEQDPRLRLPPVSGEPAHFGALLERWGGGFLKPRYGALGVGVGRVGPGDALPDRLPSVVDGLVDPPLLQWPVPPPSGFAGRVLRVLAQRTLDAEGTPGWHLLPPVLRDSVADPVVNAARGARVIPAEDDLSEDVLGDVRAQVLRVCARLEAVGGDAFALELGVDLALDADQQPWVLEVNSRSRGRLGVLARRWPDRFEAAHRAAMVRPLHTLWRWHGPDATPPSTG